MVRSGLSTDDDPSAQAQQSAGSVVAKASNDMLITKMANTLLAKDEELSEVRISPAIANRENTEGSIQLKELQRANDDLHAQLHKALHAVAKAKEAHGHGHGGEDPSDSEYDSDGVPSIAPSRASTTSASHRAMRGRLRISRRR